MHLHKHTPRTHPSERLVTVTPVHNSVHTTTQVHTVTDTNTQALTGTCIGGRGRNLAVGTARRKEQGCGVLCVIVCRCVRPHVPVYEYWILL